MAARRISKSAVDWTAFAAKVPAEQREFYRSFKARCDKFAAKVYQYPENKPAIDFAFYKNRLPAALVDQFQKQYESLEIAYPKDTSNTIKTIEAEEVQMKKETEEFIAAMKQQMAVAQANLEMYDKVPGPDHMTQEMYFDYFPHKRIGYDRPSMWPHTKSAQPGNPEHFG